MTMMAAPLSRKQIRELALGLRRICGLESRVDFPVMQFLEWILADPDRGADLEILPDSQMDNIYGLTNTFSNVIMVRESVYKGAVHGIPRDRFTLCHEIGHFFLHRPEIMSFARGEVPKYRDPEWQANTFAGELMAPYELTKDMSIDEMVLKCGMSRLAAAIQYKCYHSDRKGTFLLHK